MFMFVHISMLFDSPPLFGEVTLNLRWDSNFTGFSLVYSNFLKTLYKSFSEISIFGLESYSDKKFRLKTFNYAYFRFTTDSVFKQ